VAQAVSHGLGYRLLAAEASPMLQVSS